MKKKLTILALYLVLAIIPFTFNYNGYIKTESMDALIESLETETPNLLEKYKIPGAAISILENGRVKWIGTFGSANTEDGVKVSKDTVFQVASISKSVTALGIMKLVEQEKINLDDPIENYITRWKIPESMYDKNEVTIRRLLSHTSGLSVGGGYPGYESSNQLPTLEESLSGIGGGSRPVELVNEPGIQYRYSGGGYNLLQLLIEEVTGEDFATFMKEEVLIPLGMSNSSFLWDEKLRTNTAKAYDVNLEILPNYLFIEKAAAGLYTTIGDMSRLIIAELEIYNGSGIFQSETIREMYEPVLEVKGLEGFIYDHTALGHFVNFDSNNNRIVAHDGGNNGWRANFSLATKKGNGVVILTNGNNGDYLLTEVQNSWYYTIFQEDRSFDKLEHSVIATIYALTSILILWSGLILIKIAKGVKEGSREVREFSNKKNLIIRCFISLVLILMLYLIYSILVPILSFVNPYIGNTLFLGILIRNTVVIIQMFITTKPKGLTGG